MTATEAALWAFLCIIFTIAIWIFVIVLWFLSADFKKGKAPSIITGVILETIMTVSMITLMKIGG